MQDLDEIVTDETLKSDGSIYVTTSGRYFLKYEIESERLVTEIDEFDGSILIRKSFMHKQGENILDKKKRFQQEVEQEFKAIMEKRIYESFRQLNEMKKCKWTTI